MCSVIQLMINQSREWSNHNAIQECVIPPHAVLIADRVTSLECCGGVGTAPDVTSALSATMTTSMTYVISFCVLIHPEAMGRVFYNLTFDSFAYIFKSRLSILASWVKFVVPFR